MVNLNLLIGRPPANIDLTMARQLLGDPSISVSNVARRFGVHRNTLYRHLYMYDSDGLRAREEAKAQALNSLNLLKLKRRPNPWCIQHRIMMRKRESGGYECPECRKLNPRPIGRPLKEIDCQRASQLIQKHSVIEAAAMLGVDRNFLYRRISKGQIAGRPFRTWTQYRESTRSASPGVWPYLNANQEQYADDLTRRVNDAVPRSWPDHIRADVCQDITVAVLTGELSIDQIPERVKSFISRHFKMFPIKDFQTASLDAPLRSRNGDRTETRLIDTIESESYYEAIRVGSHYGQSLADCETAEDFAERLEGAWEAGRLTRERKVYARLERPQVKNPAPTEYDHWRRRYALSRSGRVITREFEPVSFSGAWSVETATPEELREEQV